MIKAEFFNRATGEMTYRTYKTDWWQAQAIARNYAYRNGLVLALISKEY